MRASKPLPASISAFLAAATSLSERIFASSSAISLLRASFAALRRSTAKSVFLSSSFCSDSLILPATDSTTKFASASSAFVFSVASVMAAILVSIMLSSECKRLLLYSASLSFFSSSLQLSLGSSRLTSDTIGSLGSKPNAAINGSTAGTAGSLVAGADIATNPLAASASRCLSDLQASSMLMPLRTSSRMRSFSFSSSRCCKSLLLSNVRFNMPRGSKRSS